VDDHAVVRKGLRALLDRESSIEVTARLRTLLDEVSAWGHDRNVKQSGIDWRFTTDDARVKLRRLYPAMLP
jgi:DNA-binding NarL/FixJ family response regulator